MWEGRWDFLQESENDGSLDLRVAVCQCEVAGERVSDGAPHSQISGSSVSYVSEKRERAENTDVWTKEAAARRWRRHSRSWKGPDGFSISHSLRDTEHEVAFSGFLGIKTKSMYIISDVVLLCRCAPNLCEIHEDGTGHFFQVCTCRRLLQARSRTISSVRPSKLVFCKKVK